MERKSKVLKCILLIVLSMLACLFFFGCEKVGGTEKGITIPMETYYIGRFSIGVPLGMKQASRVHALRDTDVIEVSWPKGKNYNDARNEVWDNFTAEVKKLKAPRRADKVIIKKRDFPEIGQWAKGVFYHKKGDDFEEATWSALMDAGPLGVWFKTSRAVLIEDDMKSNNASNNIAIIGNAYRVIEPNAPKPKGDWFYLQYGAINLPYKWQESSYVRFEGHPTKLKIEIKMNETYNVEPGLIERTNSGMTNILGKYVTGVSVDRLRSKKRVAAGLDGEEEILRMSDNDGKTLYFHWAFAGKEDSGEYPEINVEIESPDGNLEEKLKIWDAILDSMQPMYK